MQAIQTKTMGNNTIHLVKAKVVGAILHVEFIAVPPKKGDGSYESIPGSSHKLADFDYIDEATSKKVGLLQDESGKYMADPPRLRRQGDSHSGLFAPTANHFAEIPCPAGNIAHHHDRFSRRWCV